MNCNWTVLLFSYISERFNCSVTVQNSSIQLQFRTVLFSYSSEQFYCSVTMFRAVLLLSYSSELFYCSVTVQNRTFYCSVTVQNCSIQLQFRTVLLFRSQKQLSRCHTFKDMGIYNCKVLLISPKFISVYLTNSEVVSENIRVLLVFPGSQSFQKISWEMMADSWLIDMEWPKAYKTE